MLDSVGSGRVLDVVREEIGSRESEGDSRDGEEAVASLHLEDDEGGRDDQDQEPDDRGADDLSAEEPQGDENRRGDRQEEGSVEEVEDEGDDADQDEQAVHGRIAQEAEEPVVDRFIESRDQRTAEPDRGEERIERFAHAGDEAEGGGLGRGIGGVVLGHADRRGYIVAMPLGEGPDVRHHRVLDVLLLERVPADDIRSRGSDDGATSHVHRVGGQGDVAARGSRERARWHERVYRQTALALVLHLHDRGDDLLHVPEQPARRVHDDDEIPIRRQGGLRRAFDVVRRSRVDLDVEGHEEGAVGTREGPGAVRGNGAHGNGHQGQQNG